MKLQAGFQDIVDVVDKYQVVIYDIMTSFRHL